MHQQTANKVVEWDVLLEQRDEARRQGKSIVWTNGCFDILHVGHVQNLQQARSLGDRLVVGLNSDESVRRLKGLGRPINRQQDRALVLAALGCVDHVIVFDETTPTSAILKLKPAIHCKGADYAPPHGKPIPEATAVASYGGRIEFLPLVAGSSTSRLIERICDERDA
jgi:D-beta-D-heptose 7-phosphate kinase/D-beta-D-heptose 1-phosphate adenosyltransferase